MRKFLLLSEKANLIDDGVSLNQLSNHQKEAKFLSSALKNWLDKEYIFMEVHSRIGQVVGDCYLDARLTGIDDLGHMVMQVGTRLESEDLSDAFMSSWDIANKVSDILLVLLDRETCSCVGDLSFFLDHAKQVGLLPTMLIDDEQPNATVKSIRPRLEVDIKRVRTLQRELSSAFARYQTIKDFLEGTV